MPKVKVAIASDHAGYAMKKMLIPLLIDELGLDVTDLGTNSAESVDYPDFSAKLAKSLLSGKADNGIIICGTGIGASIAANRYKGIRAALCLNDEMAKTAREHNHANVLALGARIMDFEDAMRVVRVFMSTPFDNDKRHIRRIEKIDILTDDKNK